MNLPDFSSLLVHPVSRKPLAFYAGGESEVLVEPESGDSFEIKDNVVQLLPRQNAAQLPLFDYRDHYQKDALVYDYFDPPEGKTEAEERRRLHQHILAQVPDKQCLVLDMGCGGGWLSQSLAPEGYAVISADISDINPAKAVALLPLPNHLGLVADALFLPLRDAAVDCIVASEIIEHVPDPGRFMASLYAALKPGGKLIITTPYNEFIRHSLCIHCNRNTPHNAHLHSFTEQTIRAFVPPGATDVQTMVFASKVLSALRLLRAFTLLPFPLFRLVDKCLTVISGKKASRLMVVIRK